jgi:baculoviral IAP repeat-containing protein 6
MPNSLSVPNYIQKIHITLKKYRRTGLANETLERGLMLVRRTFFVNLLEMIMQTNVENDQIRILELLNWIFYNHFSIGSKELKDLLEVFEKYLDRFLVIFYLRGNRTISKKATQLLNFLLNKNVDNEKTFGTILFDNLMHFFKFIPVFESSASLHWYFMLIHQVMQIDPKKTFDVCMDMLIKLSKGHKYNYLYALLKMRYNLSCLLFENSLFDADLYLKFDITHQKLIQSQQPTGGFTNPYSFSFGSVGIAINKNNLTNQINNTTGSGNNNNNMKNSNNQNSNGLFNSNMLNSSIKELNLLPQSMGLIEVLPLKFKYLSSSNGTTIEKNNNNSSNNKQESPFYVLPDYFAYLDPPKPASEPSDSDKNQSESPVNEQASQPFENEIQSIMNQTVDLSIFNSIFTFHPLQCLIVERMEPVSRHFVVIDFTFPVAITDIIIPACAELSSLSIDYWLVKEQKDSKRLCVSTTISQSPILLNDLQPSIICRYIKLIYVSQSTNTAKAKIPIGYFFGHPYIFHNNFSPANEANQSLSLPNIFKTPSLWSSYISYLEKLLEENQCHYLMSIAKLRELLNEIQFPSDNIGHLKMMQFNFNENNDFSNKVKSTYKECLDFQYKLNLNAKLIKRLRSIHDPEYQKSTSSTFPDLNADIKMESLIGQMSQDKLRVTCGLLIKSLLCLTNQINNSEYSLSFNRFPESKIDLNKACILFRDLCVYGNYENECSLLLLRCCFNEPWWGQFVSNCLKKFFVSQVKEVIPMSKAFITLNEICLKSLNGTQTNNLFECLVNLVNEILDPLKSDGCVEVTSLEWILLFISRLLISIDISKDIICRWEFLENTCSNFKLNPKPLMIRNKTKMKKKIFQSSKYFNWNKMKDSRRTIDKNRKKFL